VSAAAATAVGASPAPRVLVFMEAHRLTGPAKNLLEVAGVAGSQVRFEVATFVRGGGPARNPFLEACAQAGMTVHAIRERRAGDFGVLAQMRRLARARTPDLVQTHSVKSHFLVRWSGLAGRHRWIAFHHGYTSTNRRMALYNRLDRFSLPAAERVVTVCAAFARELERAGVARERLVVRHNSVRAWAPVAAEEVARLRAAMELPPAARVLLAVGRLSREKGHADLLQAMAWIHAHQPRPELHLVLVGDGPEKERLQAAARQAGIAAQVRFAGQQPQVQPFYGLAEAVVIPSHSEGSPNVLLEAMAAGLPIAATAVGGIPEIVTDGREALLVPSQAPREMAQALLRLLADGELRQQLGARAQARAAEHSPQAHGYALVELYQSLLGPQ